MRLISAACGLVALAFSHNAAAVTVSSISFSPEFQTELEENIGVREGEVLRGEVERAVASALSRRGLSDGPGTIEIVIVDADPNRPTMRQLSNRPGLDYMRSVSIGGAELRGVVRTDDGRVTEVQHRGYSQSFVDLYVSAFGTWSEARRDIRRFAEKVADAYSAHSPR